MNNNNDTAPLTFKEKVGYGLGDMASNFYMGFFGLFLLYYYTDVFGLSAAAVGTMFFVTKLWDAINDPLMGAFIDRMRYTEKRGKYAYLMRVTAPVTVFAFDSLVTKRRSGMP